MKKIKLTLLLTLMVFCVDGCSEGDLDKTNPNQLVVSTYYQTEDDLVSGVNAIYGTMSSSNLFAREYFFTHDLRDDDNGSGGGQLEAARNQILLGTHNSGNSLVQSVWTGLYQVIFRANIIINKAPEASEASEAAKKELIAEAKCARGWAYYELGSTWGGAPIYTMYSETFSETQPKSSQEEVFAQAIQDLTEAAADLPWPPGLRDKGRLSKGAALTLLGRVLMFKGDFPGAKAAFDQVVQSNQYHLMDEYDDNYQEENEYNSESIWEIGFSKVGDFNWDPTGDGTGNEGSVRTQEYSAVGWRNVVPSASLVDEFERPTKGDPKTDPRLHKSFYFIGDSYNNGNNILEEGNVQGNKILFDGVEQKVSWRKFSAMYKEDVGGYYVSGINQRVLLYSEVLLNLAECELETGSLPKAIEYLNMTRTRSSVDMPTYPTARFPVGTKDQIMAAIIHEKRVELSSLQVRDRDIIRWRAQGKLTYEPISYFTPNKYERLPIPQSEIDNNASMSEADQNPGY